MCKMKMNVICYEKVSKLVKDGHQVMVFVHSRKETVGSAQSLYEESQTAGESSKLKPKARNICL